MMGGIRLTPHTLCYLGTPYSKYPQGLHAAFVDAAKITAKLMLAGITVYSPIVHMHPIAIEGGLDPLDYKIWLPANQAMMDLCPVLIVAHMESWESSFGLAHEIAFFEARNKQINDLNPETMTLARRQTVRPPRDRFDGIGADDLEKDRRTFLQNNPLAHGKSPSEHGGGSA